MARTVPRTVPVWSLGEARALLAGGAAGDATGALAGTPLLAVALDGAAPDDVAAVAAGVGRLPCVVVGVAATPRSLAEPPPLDVLIAESTDAPPPWRASPEGVDAALAALAAGIATAPHAATTLVQVLRLGRRGALVDGLTVESLAYAMLQAGPEHRGWLDARAARRVGRAQRGTAGPAAGPGGEPVGLARVGESLTVTLQRPQVRNAVDTATRDGLVAAFDLAACDPGVTRVELRGAGSDFCSGGDLREFGTTPDPVTGHLVRATRSPARALAGCAARTTAHVQGACVGAGVELAALAARVVAAPDATFRLPELSMGLVPGAGGTATVPRRIGAELTAWMALTGAPVDAATAVRWGLADEIA